MKWTPITIGAMIVAGIGGYVIGSVIHGFIAFVIAVVFGLCIGAIGGITQYYMDNN